MVDSAAITALAGVVGVAAGSLTTGLVQRRTARSDRRRAAMVAARLLCADLGLAYSSIRSYQAAIGRTQPERLEPPNLDYSLITWEQRRAEFAAAVSAADFHIVADAFAGLGSYCRWRARGERVPDTLTLIGLGDALNTARAVTWVAAGTKLEEESTSSTGVTIGAWDSAQLVEDNSEGADSAADPDGGPG